MVYNMHQIAVFTVYLLVNGCSSVLSDICLTDFKPVDASFNDTDTMLYEYSHTLDSKLWIRDTTTPCAYLKINGTQVIATVNLQEQKHCEISQFICSVGCESNVKDDIRLKRQSIPSGSLKFKNDTYYVTVRENDSPNNVIDFSNELIRTDCFPMEGVLVLTYNDSGPFYADYRKMIKLLPGHQLDYEEKQMYTLQIMFENTVRSANTTLIVKVQDVDDMDPVFNDSSYKYEVFENTFDTIWKTALPKIAAYDKDVGDGRKSVMYYFLDGSADKEEEGKRFSLNSENGTIMVRTSLDRETKSEYPFKIKVVQSNNHDRSATADLTIFVKDVNDNLPVFTNPPENTRVDEHSSQGTFICTVSAIDKDAPPNDKTTYRLMNYTDIFSVYSNTNGGCVIKVNDSNKLDKEILGDNITLMIQAIDSSNGTEGGNTTVNINIIDINDNTPIFNETSYSFHASRIGVIGQVSATDKDDWTNGNGVVQYFLPHEISPVKVNNTTGEIYLHQPLIEDLEIFVEACDNPVQLSSKRCSHVKVFLLANITEAVDVYKYLNISENVRAGTFITLLSKGSSFEMITPSAVFKVNNTSGIVSTATDNIDRDAGVSEYTLNIHVKAKNLLVENVTLCIEILDVNDNAPVYERRDYFFKIPDTPSVGMFIGNVKAADNDTGDNAVIEYILPESIVSPYFSVNMTTGDIRLSTRNLPAGKDVFQLIVVAKDRGIPSLEASCNVYISRIVVENTLVKISTPIEASVISNKKGQYKQQLNEILSPVIIEIVNISSYSTRKKRSTHRFYTQVTRSYLHISATNSTGSTVPTEDLQRLVLQHMEAIQELFATENSAINDSGRTTFEASQIALVVMAAVILAGGILAIYIIFRTRKPADINNCFGQSVDMKKESVKIEEEQAPLTDRLSTESMEITMELGEERDKTSDYEGSHNSNDQAVSEFENVECINPAYENSDDTVLQTDRSGATATEEAEEHLNQLTEMLNKEEENSRKSCDFVDIETSEKETNVANHEDVNNTNDLESNQLEMYPPKADYVNIDGSVVRETNNTVQSASESDYINTKIWGPETNEESDHNSEETIKPEDNNQEGFSVNSNSATDSNISVHNYENVSNPDDEPDIDYNDKQVRFSTVVLDTEENKFEPLKSESSKTKSNKGHPETDFDDENSSYDESTNEVTDVTEKDDGLLINEEESTAF